MLAEEWTYPTALACAQPWGIKFASVAVDGEGLSAVDLRKVLAEWNEVERGGKRFAHHLILWSRGLNATSQTPCPLYHSRWSESYRCCKLTSDPAFVSRT